MHVTLDSTHFNEVYVARVDEAAPAALHKSQ